MKKLIPNSLPLLPGALCLSAALLANNAAATIKYWDNNGTGTPSNGIWDTSTPNWSTTSAGQATPTTFSPGDLPVFNAVSGPLTLFITNNTANLSVNGIYNNGIGGFSGFMTFVGSGSFSFPAGGNSIWSTGGRTTKILIPINGPGQVQTGGGTGSLYLYATNGYTGGTLITVSAGVNINNSYPFGTGSIAWSSGISPIIADPDATFPLNITNSVVATAGTSFIATGAQPITWSGPWSLPAGTLTIQNGNSAYPTFQQTFSGKMSGSGGIAVIGTGTLTLSGANTYTGSTTVNSRTNATILSGSIAGDAIVSSGSLKVTSSGFIGGNVTISGALSALELDSAANLTNKTTVNIDTATVTNGAVALNFSGTQNVLALKFGGVLQSSGTYGAVGSSATYQYPWFSGNGVLSVAAAPVIVGEPQSVGVYPQTASRSFTVAVTGDQSSMQYQWKFNGGNLSDSATVSGSQTATLTLFPPFNGGTYTCAINNVAGATNTLPATLTILATNDYVNAVLQDVPLGYWRLDETNGSTAYDWVGGHHAGYINVNIAQPGFSVVSNSDLAISVPKDPAQRGYVGYTNAAPDFAFTGTPYTLEAWAYSTNFSGNQRIISTAANAGGGYALSFAGNNQLMFTCNYVDDWGVTVPNYSPGQWYHCVVTFDGNNYTLYLNGQPLATRAATGFVANPAVGLLCFGNDDPTFRVNEQVQGGIDEVALYNTALSSDRVMAHYLARYSDAPLTVGAPTLTPSTNYVSLSATLSEAASGAGLTYQWYHGSGTGSPVGSSSTSSTLTLGPLQVSDAGSYHCVVTDAGNHTQDTPTVYLAVVPIPTSAGQLNLTNGLVVHLPFDSDYKDISGRNNNGTPVGSPSFVATGAAVGSGALHYSTTSGTATNYVTLGVAPDLQFGASSDFTVSYWVRGAANAGLPFICDSTNGLAGITALNGGLYFGPDTAGDGGFSVGVGSTAHAMTTSGTGTLNDGNWHHLLHVVNRSGYATTYMDGAQVDSHVVSFVTDSVNSGLPVNIGQDGTALLAPAAASGDIDDVAIWNRQLTQFEVSGVWLAGATNHVSVAPVVVTAPPLTATTISGITATTLSYTGGSGTHFVLRGTNNLAAPMNTWPRLLTNSATPGSFTLPTSTNSAMFYRVSSEN